MTVFRLTLPAFLGCALLSLGFAARAADRPAILGISHVTVKATNLDKSLGFYRDLLGFEVAGDNPSQGAGKSCVLKVSDDQWIEVVEDPALKKPDRISQVSFQVASAEGLRAYLAAHGAAGVPEAVVGSAGHDPHFSVKDPHGYSVDFIEYTPSGWAARNRGKFLAAGRISSHLKHLGIAIDDLKADQAFYIGELGFQESWRGAADPKQLSWIHQRVPNGGDFVEWMLLAPVLPHFCLEVPNMAEAQAQLEHSPAFASYGKKLDMHLGKNRKRQLNLFDPEGTRVELMEPDTIDGKPTPPSPAPLPARFAAAASTP